MDRMHKAHAFGKTNIPSGAEGVVRVIDAVRVEHGARALTDPTPAMRRWPHYSTTDIRQSPEGWSYVDTTNEDMVTSRGNHQTIACSARQTSDQITCAQCGIAWDMNDRYPPECGEVKRHEYNKRTDAMVKAALRDWKEAEQDSIMDDLSKVLFLLVAGSWTLFSLYMWGPQIIRAVHKIVGYF